jgi:AraC-like DNA-binding protein
VIIGSGRAAVAAARRVHGNPIRPDEVAALERGMAYVRAHFATRPRLSEVADASGLSPYHFHRRFRLHYGQTPKG